ncbi:MAG: hypothetical protein HOJ90_04120, partial [Alphaproteobacteria bacterium]|nr:hypothetical protein [Alphaproteobacteria bacterium]
MKRFTKHIAGLSTAAIVGAATLAGATSASADAINIRIASGHPPTVVYAGLMKNFFQTELKKAIEAKTDHTVNFIEGYSGSIVKVFDTFEGVQNGVVDIGGFCYCFEASKLPMHAFQIMLPFGTMDPVQSVGAAGEIYNQYPSLAKRFQGFDQTLLAIIGDGGYNLGTNFEWKKLEDLKGHKILGAGLNLNWMEQAGIGIVPVTDGLPGWYQK